MPRFGYLNVLEFGQLGNRKSQYATHTSLNDVFCHILYKFKNASSNPNLWKTGKALLEMLIALDEWLRIDNQDIWGSSTGIKGNFWGSRGGSPAPPKDMYKVIAK
jgi:hypothetical protein